MGLEIFSNSTQSGSLTWIPNPTTRGTANILQTCILTLFLCIWRAVHLNLPEFGEPTFLKVGLQTWRRVGWMLISLLAPELVVYTAWCQLVDARHIVRYYNERKNSDQEPWTLAHGFYVVMGGFALRTPANPTSEGALPHTTMALDLQSIELLIDQINASDLNLSRMAPSRVCTAVVDDETSPNASKTDKNVNDKRPDTESQNPEWDTKTFLDVSKSVILDKSKSDGLAKAIMWMQAFWFCAQIITRVILSLPITLLELNTFGHSICALLIYLIWWEKPANVDQPSVWEIRSAHERALWVALNMHKTVREVLPPKVRGNLIRYITKRLGSGGSPEPEIELKFSPAHAMEIRQLQHSSPSEMREPWFQAYPCTASLLEDRMNGVTPRYWCPGMAVRVPPLWGHVFGLRLDGLEDAYSIVWYPNLDLTGSQVNQPATDQFPFCFLHLEMANRDTNGQDPDATTMVGVIPDGFEVNPPSLTRRVRNWPKFVSSRSLALLALLPLTSVYGALHCLAWNANFPSKAERLLWQISSIILASAWVPVWICYSLFSKTWGTAYLDPPNPSRLGYYRARRWLTWLERTMRVLKRDTRFKLRVPSMVSWWVDKALAATIVICIVFMLVSRAYLLTECFIQLVHLPPGPVFTQAEWPANFPHFG
ncbi:hypothetical protein B0T19DRAFT_87419 [Cercophora scortea]|uniref:Uncharacterized protein n=1 Tax=Cercophora scortea TaxID=314031 RepID=A0AAE0MGM3_9PEZI|nr:hypothetical protein B0T19DRAFT_87419 [Cercophora scortea]